MANQTHEDNGGTTRALITQGDMSPEKALDLINTNQALSPLNAEDIYVFRMTISNQAIDSYSTRMAHSTLNNYAQDFAVGRALMNSHRAGGFGGSELPIGRTFAADLSGQSLAEDAPYEATGGSSVGVYPYIQRGLKITEISTDDAIKGIEGGTIRDVSVGFTMNPDGWYRCSVCGEDMADWHSDCTHVPGARYDQGRAFAWVENGHAREASLVYKGATPGAMIDKAVRMLKDGKLSQREARMLEDEWSVRLFGEKTFAVDKVVTPRSEGAAGVSKNGQPPVGKADEKTSGKEEKSMDWDAFLGDLRSVNPTLADSITALSEADRPGGLVKAFADSRSSVEKLTAEVADLKPRAKFGDDWLDGLVDEAVKARVQAEADKFDAENWRKVLRATNDPVFIKGEVESWQRRAKDVLGDGKRPTAKANKQAGSVKKPDAVYKA
jgi:hypothetical protein